MAFPTAARSLTFLVASRTPRASSHFRDTRPWFCATLHLAMCVRRLARFARSGARLPLFKGQAAVRLETPSVVHPSREVCPLSVQLRAPPGQGSPEAPAPVSLRSSIAFASTRSRIVPSASPLGPEGHLAEPPASDTAGTSCRRMQPTFSVFKDEHPRLARYRLGPGLAPSSSPVRPIVTAMAPRFGGPEQNRGLFVSIRFRDSDRTSDAPSLPGARISTILPPVLPSPLPSTPPCRQRELVPGKDAFRPPGSSRTSPHPGFSFVRPGSGNRRSSSSALALD